MRKRDRAMKQASSFINQQPFQNLVAIGWVCTALGSVYQNLGYVREAQAFLEKSLDPHKKNFPDNHVYVLYACLHLGTVYQALHQPTKAKELFEKVLKGYKHHYGKDHQEQLGLYDI
jgi:tetratricopeptide (TPR) repeat protein